MKKQIVFNKNSTTYKYITEMFLDGLSYTEIAKHLGLNKKLVLGVLKEQFGTKDSLYTNPKQPLSLPNVKNDIVLCQLALLANISPKVFNEFVNKVRDLNMDIVLTNPRLSYNKFFKKTPDLEFQGLNDEAWY